MKSLRLSFMLLSGLFLGLLFASAGLSAQNPFQPGAKYRTHFVIYDVQKKTTTTVFTVEGEWHAPNWTADGKYFVCDMGGEHISHSRERRQHRETREDLWGPQR